MTTSNWINLLLGSGLLITVFQYLNNKLKANDTKTQAVCYGVQALLRDRLYEQYEKYHNKKRYAPIWVKNNYENMYKRYHVLGENGVMDQHYEEFMKLPDKEIEEDEN